MDRSTVEKVARLARLRLSDEEAGRLASELSRILDHVARLEQLDVAGVPPLTHGTGGRDVYRADEPGPVLDAEAVLRGAPDRHDGLFRVPRVIEEP